MAKDANDKNNKKVSVSNKKETSNKTSMNQNEKNDKKSTLKKIDKSTSDFTKVLVAKSKGLQRTAGERAIVYDEDLLKDLKEIIAKYTEHPEILDEINVKYSGQQQKLEEVDAEMESNFIERLNIDSVDFVEIIVDTEEKFGIKIEDEEVKKIVNLDEMYLMIQSKIEAKKLRKTKPKKSVKVAKTAASKKPVAALKELDSKKPVKNKTSIKKAPAEKVIKPKKAEVVKMPVKVIKKVSDSAKK